MLWEMFTFFIVVAVVLFLAGFWLKNYPLFMASGVLFLLLATAVFGSGLTFKTGEIINQVAPCPDYVNDTCLNEPSYNITTNMNYVYTSVQGVGSAVLGSFLLAMTFFAFGCALVYATPQKDR